MRRNLSGLVLDGINLLLAIVGLLVELATSQRHQIDAVMGSFVTTIRATIDPTNSDYDEDDVGDESDWRAGALAGASAGTGDAQRDVARLLSWLMGASSPESSSSSSGC